MFFNMIENPVVRFKGEQHLALEGQTSAFRRFSAPCLGFRICSLAAVLCVAIELCMIGIVGDSAAVPKRGIIPGRRADSENRARGPCRDATSFSLSDRGEMSLYEFKLLKWLQ